MENEVLNKDKYVKSGTISSDIRTRKKLSMTKFYAGVILFYVPSILCDSDRFRPKHLTYDSIFNSTNYVQIYHSPRPYGAVSYSFRSQTFSEYPKNKIEQTSLIEHRPNNEFRHVLGHRPVKDSKPIIVNRPAIDERPILQLNTIKEEPLTLRNISSIDEDIKGNELEYEEFNFSEEANEQLLVGVSHDPFRYSVPEKDYMKGVRSMDAEIYKRGKRGVFHLYNMMYCATGCEPLAYKGYGCYCGFLGSGKPTDGIDKCCKMHDECYENIFCPFYTVYFQPYYWKCYRGQPLCALENYKSQHQFINGCAGRLCECDRRFAMCVKRYACPRRRALCRSSPIRLLQNLLMFK